MRTRTHGHSAQGRGGSRRRLAQTVDRAAARVLPPAAREPLEVAHGDRRGRRARGAAGGPRPARCFRSTAFRCGSRRRRARCGRALEATFAAEPTLAQRIHARLDTAGCPVPDLTIAIDYVESAGTRVAHARLPRRVRARRGRGGARAAARTASSRQPAPRSSSRSLAGTAEQPRLCVPAGPHRHRALRRGAGSAQPPGAHQSPGVCRHRSTRSTRPCRAATRISTIRPPKRRSASTTTAASRARAWRGADAPSRCRPARAACALQSGDEIVLGLARVKVKLPATPGQV